MYSNHLCTNAILLWNDQWRQYSDMAHVWYIRKID